MTKVINFGNNLYTPLNSPWYLNALGLPDHVNEEIGLPRGQISLSRLKLPSGKVDGETL